MRFSDVAIAGIGVHLPERVVSSASIEAQLEPLYQRLKLPAGRLELMSGIAERRFWPQGTRPSTVASAAGAQALQKAGVAADEIGCLIHASVCRDFLEPATANLVHESLGLPPTAMLFDLSNACLGVLNGMVLVAQQIESGAISAGLVVSGECGESLVEHTIAHLLADPSVTRKSIKDQVASLTIGSAAAAVVLRRASDAPAAPRLLGGALRCATQHHRLCWGDVTDGAGEGPPRPLMTTRSEALLQAGCQLAGETWADLLTVMDWSQSSVDRVFCHQVGSAHRKLMLETIGVPLERDYPTFPHLGNTGSAALPTALGQGLEAGVFGPGQRAALLGIGSGINCLMLGVEHP